MMLKVVFRREFTVWIELREKGGSLIDTMTFDTSNNLGLDALSFTMSATTASA
jgi:hypothetical protein